MNDLTFGDRGDPGDPGDLGGLDDLDAHRRRNGLGLEHRLHDLAGHVEAPPSTCTREVIGRRSRVLRRRRHMRRAAAGGALVVAAVVGAVALRHDPAVVKTGPANDRGSGDLPVIGLDLDGWRFDSAAAYDDVGDLTDAEADSWGMSEQVFRPVDRLDGPVAYLVHRSASDVISNDPAAEQVDVNGATGYLSERGLVVSLRWNPAPGDSEAELSATGLEPDEVLDLARELVLRDDDLQVPARADDELGFDLPDPAELPDGWQLTEVSLPGGSAPVDVHKSWYEGGSGGTGLVEIQVDNRGERAFETGLYAPVPNTWDVFEQVTVLGEPGVLRHDAVEGDWTVHWRHAERAWVTVTISSGTKSGSINRVTVDEIIDHLQDLPADQWSTFADR